MHLEPRSALLRPAVMRAGLGDPSASSSIIETRITRKELKVEIATLDQLREERMMMDERLQKMFGCTSGIGVNLDPATSHRSHSSRRRSLDPRLAGTFLLLSYVGGFKPASRVAH